MNRKNFWSALFGVQKRFSFDDLHNLYNVLVRNPVVTDANKALIIETYRSIAEFMIWGDQNEPRVFEFFLENNVMVYLHKVLLHASNRRGDVAKQVLQTLSIIIQNVRSETGIFFLFSNNHINNIVELEFDFEDEEVLGYYVSFLKAISLKLNSGTVQFFLDDRSGSMVFPLYTEAIKFAHHKEGMVRAGVRTLTLNVYSVEDHDVQMYVTTSSASTYFAELSNYIVDQVQSLDRRFQAAQSGTNPNALAALDSQLAELEDMISYVSDIFSVGSPPVAELVSEQLWSALAGPLMFWPLLGYQLSDASAACYIPATPTTNQQDSRLQHQRPASITDSTLQLNKQASTAEGNGTRISVWCALYLLERWFHIITYPPLLHHMLFALLSCPKVPLCSPSNPNPPSPKKLHFDDADPKLDVPTTDRTVSTPALSREPSRLVAMSSLTLANDSFENLAGLHTPRATDSVSESGSGRGKSDDGTSSSPASSVDLSGRKYCRDVLLGIVNGGDIRLVSATLRLLVALLQNKHVAPEPLYLLGLMPPHKMMQVASGNPEATHHQLYAWYKQLHRIQQSTGACCATPSTTAEATAATPCTTAATTDCAPPSKSPSLFIMPYDHALSALSLQANLFSGPGRGGVRAGAATGGPPDPFASHFRHSSMDSSIFPDASISGSQFGTPDSTPFNSKAPSVVDEEGVAATSSMQLDLSAALPLSLGPASQRKAPSRLAASTEGERGARVAGAQAGTCRAGEPKQALETVSGPTQDVSHQAQGKDTSVAEFPVTATEVPGLVSDPTQDVSHQTQGNDTSVAEFPVTATEVPGLVSDPTQDVSHQTQGKDTSVAEVPVTATEVSGTASTVHVMGDPEPNTRSVMSVSVSEVSGADAEEHRNSALEVGTSAAAKGKVSEPDNATLLLAREHSNEQTGNHVDAGGPGGEPTVETSSGQAAQIADSRLSNDPTSMQHATSVELTPAPLETDPTSSSQEATTQSYQSTLPPEPTASPSAATAAAEQAASPAPATEAVNTPASTSTPKASTPTIHTSDTPSGSHTAQLDSCNTPTFTNSKVDESNWRGSQSGLPSASGESDRGGTPGIGSRSASQQLLSEENESLDGSPIMQELLHPRRWPQEEQVLDALMQMLLLQTLPASGMWHASWLLYQLVPCEDGKGKWTEQQSSMFRQALGVARDQVLDELSGMWCEALFPLMYMEWPISREAMLRPMLRASSDALLSGPYAYPLCRPQGPGGGPFRLSSSASAALTAYHTVLRLIALLQMQQLFQQGTIAKSSPTPAVTDADLRQHDIQEGAHVDLHPGAAIPCIVSFAPGQERRVYFAIAGVSMQRLSTVSKDLEQVGGQTVLHSLPVVILADASASRVHSGVVLSVAPLLGSDPTTDKNMNRWLHVHVRPPVRGLLRMLKSASTKKGGLLTAMRQLADGHWVLAFPDPDRALNAKMIAQQHAAKLRALYCDVLTPVITTSEQDDSDSILIPAGR